MSEPEKKRRFPNLFKTKESSSKLTSSGGAGAGASGNGGVGVGEEEGPRGGRRKLFTQLSESEKSMRRSTLGTASLSQAAQVPPPVQAPATGQLASASSGSKAVLFSRPNQPAAAAPELETPFAKMVRQSTSGTVAERGTVGPTPKSATTESSGDSAGTLRRGSNLSAEEKKTRRKSLLAPVQNLFAAMSGDGSTSAAETPSEPTTGGTSGSSGELKKKKGLFGKREKGLDFQTGLQLDDSQAKIQRERQKKLQKELDKIEKEKAKQEKARQSRLLDVLQQTLELGEERASLPMPTHRNAFAMPMRPPIET